MLSHRSDNLSIRSRGRLPHWEATRATYFITLRLADSLPSNILEAYLFERSDITEAARRLGRELTLHELRRLDQLYEERIEFYLDSGGGMCPLRDPRIAGIVAENLSHFDGVTYELIAWCIMPNHVHLVLRPLGTHQLAGIMHSCKSYTAKRANSALGRTGGFWQREYYDHIIRDQADYDRVVEYVLDNPAKAGLVNWP